jgi:hypothetical protein
MVKEIEIHNQTKVLLPGYELSPELYPDIVTAFLTNGGLSLTANVNRTLPAGFSRRVTLVYLLPKYDQHLVRTYDLGSFGPDPAYTPATEFVFDLSPVMTQIIHDPPEQLADDTINIRLYTYEANTAFNYGTCYPQYSPITAYVVGDYAQYGGRLWQCKKNCVGQLPTVPEYWTPTGVPSSGTMTFNLPYTVSYPGQAVMPNSTDGLYELRVIDAMIYDDNTLYKVGDIVNYGGGYNMCIQQTAGGHNPTDPLFWSTPDINDASVFWAAGWDANHSTISTMLTSEMLITRYVKQKHIYELLLKTNYKSYDNIKVLSDLDKIIAMREAAAAHLHKDNSVAARYMLDLLTIEVNSFTVNKGERVVVEMITNFTI